jgi:DNA-binding beta-propeller fold protein YncE
LYWSDYNANRDNNKPGAIRVGNLNGSRSASTLFANQDRATSVVIDPARGTIYWTDYKASARSSAGAVRVGRLSGVGAPTTLFLDSGGPAGLALSPAQGEIFWSDIRTGSLRMGRIDRSGPAITVLAGDNSPFGVAIDPAQREIFWTDYHKSNRANTGALKMQLLGASGPAPASVPSSIVGGESGPTFLAVAGAPAATAPPVISGGRSAGRALACTRGRWANDVLVASFYRVPQRFSYQWRRDHAAIPGATAAGYTPPVAGSYSCAVTAVNQAGATTQASAPVIVGPALAR